MGGERLDHNTLKLLGIRRRSFIHDYGVSQFIEVGEAFLDLIAGKVQTDSSSTWFMPGTRET